MPWFALKDMLTRMACLFNDLLIDRVSLETDNVCVLLSKEIVFNGLVVFYGLVV